MKRDELDDKLMHSVITADKKEIDEGKVIKEAINQNINSFTPDMMFESLVQNYDIAKRLYGPTILRYATGFSENYLERNLRIPEFKRELKGLIKKNMGKLSKDGLIDESGTITEKGFQMASISLYFEELDKIKTYGVTGERIEKKKFIYGDKDETRTFKKSDRFRDIDLKKSIKKSIRRGHKQLIVEDLETFNKKKKGQISIVYAIDTSGSMKGNKINVAKKAGIALAYKAISKKDKIGILAFNSEVHKTVKPSLDFGNIVYNLTKLRSTGQTNFVSMINKSFEMFEKGTKHLIIITDVMPNVGDNPKEDTLKAASIAKDNQITISLIGINLDDDGKKLAKQIVEISEGRLYLVKNLDNIDSLIIQDYLAQG